MKHKCTQGHDPERWYCVEYAGFNWHVHLLKHEELINTEVTVIDNSNYKSSYAEDVPFKGILYGVTNYPCYFVRSIQTGKEYELYAFQIKELEE
jgi:hypothetical protein